MSAREQLAEVIRDGVGTWRTPLEAAAAILKALAPREVTTEAELDALPGETVIRDLAGMIYELDYIVSDPSKKWWITTGDDSHSTNGGIELPATVIYSPEVAS